MKLAVQEVYFRDIVNGRKTAEGRIAKAKYLALKPGDEMTFVNAANQAESVSVKVISVHQYDSFADMLRAETLSAMLPGVANIDEGVWIYESFGDYKAAVKRHGAVAIRFCKGAMIQ